MNDMKIQNKKVNSIIFVGYGADAGLAVSEMNQRMQEYFEKELWRVIHISHNVVAAKGEIEDYTATAVVLYEEHTKENGMEALEACIH